MIHILGYKRLLPIFLAGLIPLVSGNVLAKPPVKSGGKTAPIVRMYRYTNEKGVLVTSSSISPEYAVRGYQIVSQRGDVLETIAPAPTPEERAQIAQQGKDKLTAAKQAERDRELLLRYGGLADIQLAKDRKMAEIDNKIHMLGSNITTLRQQIDFHQQSAASYERNGQEVPGPVLAKIEGLRQELKISENQLDGQKKEIASENLRFESEKERFIYLESKRPKN